MASGRVYVIICLGSGSADEGSGREVDIPVSLNYHPSLRGEDARDPIWSGNPTPVASLTDGFFHIRHGEVTH